MRFKYTILKDIEKNRISIREYAVVDKNLNNVSWLMLQENDFSLLCEENYELPMITSSISKGMNQLIGALRTPNLFPIESYAKKIAESIITICNVDNDQSVDLLFDEGDLLSVHPQSIPESESASKSI